MSPQYVVDMPLGYDEQTQMTLGPNNQIIITHPVMPPMVYDEQVMRWVELRIDLEGHRHG